MADFAEFGGDGFGAPALKPEAAGQPRHGVTFDEFGGDGSGNTAGEPQHSMLGAGLGHFAESVLPSAGALAGAETLGPVGAEVGAAAGGPIGAAIGGIGGALIGGFGGGYAVSKAQDYALTKLPDEMQGKIQNFLTETEQEYPKTSWLGGVAPYALTMSPRALEAALPADATNFQKLMASKGAQRIFSGALMGGTELGQEYASGETPDWGKVAASTGMGLIFTRPNRIGETITKPAQALGNRLGEAFAGKSTPAAEAQPPPPPPPATVAEAGDKKVLGPGVNEEVFQGQERQNEQAEAAAQLAARQEKTVLEGSPPPDIRGLARRAEPELFDRYDALQAQRDSARAFIDNANAPPQEHYDALTDRFRTLSDQLDATANQAEQRRIRVQMRDVGNEWAALDERKAAFERGEAQETPPLAAARKQLMDADYALRDTGRDVAAAYRRAAEGVGAPAVAGEAAEIATPPAAAVEAPGIVPPAAIAEGAGQAAAAAPPPKTREDIKSDIVRHVTDQLAGSKYSPEQINDFALLNASLYDTVAARAGGNAMDLYNKYGPLWNTKGIERPARAARVVTPPPTAARPSAEDAAAARAKAEALNPPIAPLIDKLSAQGLSPKEISRFIEGKLSENEVSAAIQSEAKPVPTIESVPAQPAAAASAAEEPTTTINVPAARQRPRSTAPLTLRAFLKAKGGIRDMFGELRHMGLIKEYPGLVNNKSGHPLDYARTLAAEVGYLGHDTSVADFLDAIKKHPLYTPEGQAWFDRRAEREEYNAEYERENHAKSQIDAFWKEHGEGKIDDELRDRAAEILVHNDLTADEAIERASQELYNEQSEREHASRVQENLAGSGQPSQARERPGGEGTVAGSQEALRGGEEGFEDGVDFSQIAAYHGSPHDFDRFDIKKIGTGEGAQSYGHGLYFAQKKGVAESYKDSLTPDPRQIMNARLHDVAMNDRALDRKRPIGPILEQIPELREFAKDKEVVALAQRAVDGTYSDGTYSSDALSAFRALDKKLPKREGALYTVSIDAEPEDFLDWDKPLSQQSPKVREALAKAGYDGGNYQLHVNGPDENGVFVFHSLAEAKADQAKWTAEGDHTAEIITRDDKPEMTGAEAYNDLRTRGGHKYAGADEAKLAAAGIKGIRYLDQGSRITSGGELFGVEKTPNGYVAKIKVSNRGGVGFVAPTDMFTTSKPYATESEARAWADETIGSGSHNFVVFDDGLIKITHKNGEPIKGEEAEVARKEVAEDNAEKRELFQKAGIQERAKGQINFRTGQRPLATLFKDADFSTLVHEGVGHPMLEMLRELAERPDAPEGIKQDWTTARDWMRIRSADEIDWHPPAKARRLFKDYLARDPTQVHELEHEKFARGFEQYLREGVAPSPGLARTFARIKQWMVAVYQTLKGLGKPISDDIRGVFDRLLAEEPQPTVVMPEASHGPTLQDIHEADAEETPSHHAEAARDRIVAERDREIAEHHPVIANEIETERAATTQPVAEAGAGQGGPSDVVEPGVEPEPQPGGVARGEAGGEEQRSGGAVKPEGAGLGSNDTAGAGGEPSTGSNAGDSARHGLAPSSSPRLESRADARFIDKAGNIRLENLTDAEDTRQALRETADQNGGFNAARRDVLSDGAVENLAQALGVDHAELMRRWKGAGTAFNAEEVIAARKLLIQSATGLSDLMKRAANGTDADVMAFAEAKAKHRMIQEVVSGVTAEAGRALRAFRDIRGSAEATRADEFVRQATGKTLWQLKEEARLFQQLGTPEAVSKFVEDSESKTFGKMLLEYWINGLISGVPTHVTYIIGNTLLSAEQALVETPAAAAIGALRQGMGRQGNVVPFGEAFARARGAARGFAPALEASAEALRTGHTGLLPGETPKAQSFMQYGRAINEDATFADARGAWYGLLRGMKDGVLAAGQLAAAGGDRNAPFFATKPTLGQNPNIAIKGVTLPTGEIIRGPSRFIATIHTFFRAMNYSVAQNGLEYRRAWNEGKRGDDLASRMADLRTSRNPEDMQAAINEATEATLMGQGGKWTQKLSGLLNHEFNVPGLGKTPMLKFIDPFVNISSNIINQALVQRTPLGVLSPQIRADLMGRNGTIAADRAAARMLAGSAYAVVFGALAAEGYVTGAGPQDPRKQAVWRQAGYQAHSVRLGDTWYDLHRLGPLGMLLGMAADVYDLAHVAETEDFATLAGAFQHAVSQSVLDESFMRGPSELLKALEDKSYAPVYIRNFVSSFVPYSVGESYTARAMDPYERQVRTIMDAIKAKIPGERETLMPKIDLWGQPMPGRAALGANATAIWEAQISRDPVNQEMYRLGIAKGPVERKIRNQTLTDDQYDEFARLAGRMTKSSLDRVINSPQWRQIPDGVKEQMIDEIFKQSREGARGLVMMRHPGIPEAAVMQKRDRLLGAAK